MMYLYRHSRHNANESLLNLCADLYSNHFGLWEDGRRIKMSSTRLQQHLSSEKSCLVTAYMDSLLVGYSIVTPSTILCSRHIVWVTQLVVHADFRDKKIATQLLSSLHFDWQDAAWGIVTTNPYALRALESAIGRRCIPQCH
jgi:hypothetical protein